MRWIVLSEDVDRNREIAELTQAEPTNLEQSELFLLDLMGSQRHLVSNKINSIVVGLLQDRSLLDFDFSISL